MQEEIFGSIFKSMNPRNHANDKFITLTMSIGILVSSTWSSEKI